MEASSQQLGRESLQDLSSRRRQVRWQPHSQGAAPGYLLPHPQGAQYPAPHPFADREKVHM